MYCTELLKFYDKNINKAKICFMWYIVNLQQVIEILQKIYYFWLLLDLFVMTLLDLDLNLKYCNVSIKLIVLLAA